MDAVHIEFLGRSKRRTILALWLTAASVLALSALRFVPRLDDTLAGKAQPVRVLTETLARQLAAQEQMQSPVIVERDEHGSFQPVIGPTIPDEEIRGTIYLITYSEQQHLTCITAYLVPIDPSKFSALRSFRPREGKNYGPALLDTVQGIAEDRSLHVYAPEYLRILHWRYTPHFPLSPSEGARLAGRTYYSHASQPDGSPGVDFDYEEIRAEVAKRHRQMNSILAVLMIGCAAVFLGLLGKLTFLYRDFSAYCRVYQLRLTPGAFLGGDMGTMLAAARHQYIEREQLTQARLRKEERLRTLRSSWAESLRAALPNLNDEQLRTRVLECLKHEPDEVEEIKSLWIEVQEQTGAKTPAAKLSILLESMKPYCAEEEFLAGRAEAFAILNTSGFRAARMFAIVMHDRFKVRAREAEELAKSDQALHDETV